MQKKHSVCVACYRCHPDCHFLCGTAAKVATCSACATNSGCYAAVLALHAATGVDCGLGSPASIPLRILAPHGCLHAIVCMYLILCCGLGLYSATHPQRAAHSVLRKLGHAVVGFWLSWHPLLCTDLRQCRDTCCIHSYALTLNAQLAPARLAEAYQAKPARRPARMVLQIVERCLRAVLQGMSLPLKHEMPPPVSSSFPLPCSMLGGQPWPWKEGFVACCTHPSCAAVRQSAISEDWVMVCSSCKKCTTQSQRAQLQKHPCKGRDT